MITKRSSFLFFYSFLFYDHETKFLSILASHMGLLPANATIFQSFYSFNPVIFSIKFVSERDQ